MAVFRIEKTRDYTVMSNYHLRDMSLSLKAKGLLSLMLSLPENWDYTTEGPCPDLPGWQWTASVRRHPGAGGRGAIIIRERVRNANGRLG